MAGARDHMPDWKTAWASRIVRLMSSELAASTLHREWGFCEHSYHVYSVQYPDRPGTMTDRPKFFDLRADVQSGRRICHV
jgi:hypothetical protein